MQLHDSITIPAENRSIPFWSWNDSLDSELLSWQIEQMAASGVGGFFMHARSGLKTEYLKDPWFDCIAVGLREGRKRGLQPWVYDEEGWPSGFAGGAVPQLGEKYYARGLRMHIVPSPEKIVRDDSLLGVFGYTADFSQVIPEHEFGTEDHFEGFLVMTHSSSPYYIDVLNPITTKSFLEITHESYFKRFGKNLPEGFFTDEPRLSEGPIPWSYILPREFQADHGYSILEQLPALYVPCQGYEKIRFDYWVTVSRLFVHSYMEQIFNWCEAHHCKLTGHMMMEESLYSQMTGTSGSMPFYKFFHMPGMDSLRRNINDPRMPKQLSSIAEQFGKKWVITESFAMSGWDLNFEEMRWIVNWQFVNGVNIVCQHLQAYSLKGFRKRDYPPSLFYQQSWYGEYSRFQDYLGRLSTLLIEGHKILEILLLHPMHSAWIAYDGTNNEQIKALDKDFIKATTMLSSQHLDYHLGDEGVLASDGSVDSGYLHIGSFAYRIVCLPSCLSLDDSTIKLLETLLDQGGVVYSLGLFPLLCEGKKDVRLEALQKRAVPLKNSEKVRKAIASQLVKPVGITEEGQQVEDVSYCLHEQEDGLSLFLVNNSKQERHKNMCVEIKGPYSVVLSDLWENERHAIPSSVSKNGYTQFNLSLLPMQSEMVFLFPESKPDSSDSYKIVQPQYIPFDSSEVWSIQKMDPNALTLDYCKYRIDGGAWHSKVPVIKLMRTLLELKRPCALELEFEFSILCPTKSIDNVCLVIEQSNQYSIEVNGQKVSSVAGWYKDRSFDSLNIQNCLVQGTNTVLLKTVFQESAHVYDILFGEKVYETELNKLTYDMEIESIYIIGDFGVFTEVPLCPGLKNSLEAYGTFFIKERPTFLFGKNFTSQGLLFFAGKLEIEKTLVIQSGEDKSLFLDLGNCHQPMLQVFLHEKLVKTLVWAPYIVDLGKYLVEGKNTLRLVFYASNRNLLGPHHHIKGENYSVGPQSFEGVFSWCERETEADEIDRSLTKVSFWKDSYTFIRFGF
ncbi:glycosyl hydrolase [uncultured Sphaerochaeta sp.]|uniref:glycosyl hydrolase n=1 Tax=uncultured Sphaerochaeta sp. TaxID=886478 RepID=UPI002A0A5305|nr:glycosyl hydrolase [uncultured Sphaerochaeta sp.]